MSRALLLSCFWALLGLTPFSKAAAETVTSKETTADVSRMLTTAVEEFTKVRSASVFPFVAGTAKLYFITGSLVKIIQMGPQAIPQLHQAKSNGDVLTGMLIDECVDIIEAKGHRELQALTEKENGVTIFTVAITN